MPLWSILGQSSTSADKPSSGMNFPRNRFFLRSTECTDRSSTGQTRALIRPETAVAGPGIPDAPEGEPASWSLLGLFSSDTFAYARPQEENAMASSAELSGGELLLLNIAATLAQTAPKALLRHYGIHGAVRIVATNS